MLKGAKVKNRRRLRRHGYLKRSLTSMGLRVLRKRRQKGRHKLTV